MESVIELSGLCKSFGHTQALDGLDLTVSAGEVHGFLGPNGAGKTTAIRVLLGLLRSDRGTARLLGGDPWHDATSLHRRLAYVPGDVTLWPSLSGGEIIDLLGRLHGGIDAKRRAGLLERFELDPAKKARAYSKGNRQKVALVAALACDVELLILDEPTSGLDPLMEAQFRSCVAEERSRGRTVLLSSHILAEAEALCDRVTIISAGRSVETGSLADLRHLTRTSIGTAALLACAGLGAGVGYGVRGGDVGGRVPWLLGAAMAQLPAALAVAGVAVVAFGLRPGWSAACGWGALALAGALVLFGPALSLGQWALDISPFTHLPKLPGATVSAPPLIWLSAIALAMTLTGLAGLRQRDIG
jgi:ABC-2 type transport system ATP-binding protein